MSKIGGAMISGAQMRMARGLLRWGVKDLAEQSGIGVTTIKRLEEIDCVLGSATVATLNAISTAFLKTGILRLEGQDGVFITHPSNASKSTESMEDK